MTDRRGSAGVSRWSPAVPVALVCVSVVALGGLAVVPVPDGAGLAAATVGLVLAEAVVLHVGYGALAHIASPAVRDLTGGD